MSRVIGVAVVGYGGMGGWHTRILQQIPETELKGVYDILPVNRIEVVLITLFLTGLAIQRHHANIGRLMSGTENKISFSKK